MQRYKPHNEAIFLLQQHLPFTVLKLEQARRNYSPTIIWNVATALTVYGIETN